MKNVIIISVDALSYKVLEKYPFPKELFINSIKDHSLVFENMYTQGPFTEASLNGLVCGSQNLDWGGFLFDDLKCPDRIHNHFVDKGYKIYTSMTSAKNRTGRQSTTYYPTISYLDYTRFPEVRRKLKNNQEVSFDELSHCRDMLKFTLLKVIRWCTLFINGDEAYSIQREYLPLDEVKKALNNYTYLLENADNFDFLKNLILTGVENYQVDLKSYLPFAIDKKEVFEPYWNKLESDYKKHKSSKGMFSLLIGKTHHFLKKPNKKALSEIKSILLKKDNVTCNMKSLFNSGVATSSGYLSMRRRIDDCMRFISNNKDDNFYIYIQPQDFHPTCTFWSYDSNDSNLIEKELSEASLLASRIPHSVKGNIYPLLSIKYVDNQIKRLFDYLNEYHLLDNTTIVVTSDHGSWEFNDYLWKNDLPIMKEERIHIPCIIFDKSFNSKAIPNLVNSYCFPNTLLKLLNMEESNYLMPSYEKYKDKYLIAENFRYGAPYIETKPIEYTIHNTSYKLVVDVFYNENVTMKKCVAFYDLRKDKYESKNVLNNKKYKQVIDEMIEVCSKRHNEVRNNIDIDSYYQIPDVY